MVDLPGGKKCENRFNSFDTLQKRDRQTARHRTTAVIVAIIVSVVGHLGEKASR